MAYCIALGTFWTHIYLLEDPVAGRRTRIVEIVRIWVGRYEVSSTSCFPPVMVVDKEDPFFHGSDSISLTAWQYHVCLAGKHEVPDRYDLGIQLCFRSSID